MHLSDVREQLHYAMLRRTAGHGCSGKVSDSTVKNSQGDLMLCHLCKEIRFPCIKDARSKSKVAAGVSLDCRPTISSGAGASTSSAGSSTSSARSTVGASASAGSGDIEPVIINELLMYVVYQRDKSTAANLLTVVTNFYSSSEISSAKRLFSQLFSTHLADCERVTERRNSAQRTAFLSLALRAQP